jgi:hypothetical protein
MAQADPSACDEVGKGGGSEKMLPLRGGNEFLDGSLSRVRGKAAEREENQEAIVLRRSGGGCLVCGKVTETKPASYAFALNGPEMDPIKRIEIG